MKISKVSKRITVIISLVVFLFLGLQNHVSAAGEIETVSAAVLNATDVRLSGKLLIEQEDAPAPIKKVGFAFGQNEELVYNAECSNLASNGPWVSPSGLIFPGVTFQKVFSFNNATPGSQRFYKACAITEPDENGYIWKLHGEVESFNFLTEEEMEGQLGAITLSFDPATLYGGKATVGLEITSQGIGSSGFSISTSSEEIPDCEYVTENEFHVTGSTRNKRIDVEAGKTYYYRSCVKDINGGTFLGLQEQFSVPEQTDDGEQEQRNERCRIDYVEFLPFNSSSANAIPGNSQFEAFVYGQGKEITLKLHPTNTNDCINVPIHTLKIQSSWVTVQGEGLQYDHNKDIEILFASTAGGGSRQFDENGQFEIKLVAGDTEPNCKYRLADYPDQEICHSYVVITYGTSVIGGVRIFKSKSTQGDPIDVNYDYPLPHDSIKGIINYARRQTKPWRLWQAGDPQGTDTVVPTYDTESPCYVAPGQPLGNGENAGDNGGYLENCYELLAPIPGIGDTVKGDRVAIGNLKDYQLGDYINIMFQVALGILMVIAVVMIVVAGVEYMTVESFYGKSDAKKRIMGAVTGLILALGIFLILRTINPQLLEINFGSGIETAKIEIAKNQDVQGDLITSEGQTFEARSTYSPELENVATKIAQGTKIKEIRVTGSEGAKTGTAQIVLTDGTMSGSIPVGFGLNGLSSNWQSGQRKTPVGTFKLGGNRLQKTPGNNIAVLSNSGKANMGAAFISVDQSPYVGIGIHGKSKKGYLGPTYGCVRMKNSDLLAIFDGIQKGSTDLIISAN